MQQLRLIWASLVGFWVDILLSTLIVATLAQMMNLSETTVDLANPLHSIVMVVLPIVMTCIGGGIAGRLAPTDPIAAGALVGGWGLILLNFEEFSVYNSYTLLMIIAQCVAVVAAALTAWFVARQYLRKQSETKE